MKISFPTLAGVSLVLLLARPAGARADLIPWVYNWSRSPTEIRADAPGTSYITLTDETAKVAVGDSNIVATNLRTFSTASPTNPDRFTAKPYALTLNLTDVQSKRTGSLTFTGEIDGWLSAQNSVLSNTFTGETTQTLLLGGSRYTATIGPFSPPGTPDSANAGAIAALVQIKVQAIVALPEPGALALAALGAALLGAARLRRRRR